MMDPLGRPLKQIDTPEESAEAAGFVMDAILKHGGVGIPNAVDLRPVEVARDSNGNIVSVVCATRPCDADSLKALLNDAEPKPEEQRFLIPAPA